MTSSAPVDDSAHDAMRVDVLKRLGLPDRVPDRAFDEIVQLAAPLCGAPISTITFVDCERQWFASSVGLDIAHTPRDIAFCNWTIKGRQPVIVSDACEDPRFASNPLVLGEPHLRFYAGFPLLTRDGVAVGTLTVMDRSPRTLGGDQILVMTALAHQVTALLDVREILHRIRKGEAERVIAQLELQAQVKERTRQLVDASARLSKVERLYHSLWETTTDAILILDENDAIQYLNTGAERLFGYPASALQGQRLAMLQPERFRHAHSHGMKRYMESRVRRVDWRATEAVGLHADGSEVPIEISFSEIEIDGARLFVGFIRDISERKRANLALQNERERAQSTLRCIGDGVVTTDEAGRVLSLNPMAERLTGWSERDASGQPCDQVVRLLHEHAGEKLPLTLGPASRSSVHAMPLPAKAMLHALTGASLCVEGSIAGIATSDGRQTGWVIALRDVSQARALADQVAFQATHDSLTGLVNRAEFDRRLRAALDLTAARQQHGSLLYLDLDQFKIVNDTCGHVAGDELLKQLSSILLSSLRSSDTLARLGGDEFGVLLENCPSEHAVRIAEKLRDAVSEFVFVWQTQLFSTGVSIGHVHFGDASLQAAEVLSKADEACYVAKDLGRNRIHTYVPGEEAQARRHGEMQWVGLIQQALDEDRFVLYAQPIFEVGAAHAAPAHYEVLLRMLDRDGGLIAPMAFIPAAERYNLMPRLDRWVVHNVLVALAAAQRENPAARPRFAINLSGATLSDPSFGRFIELELASACLPGAAIGFEVTETAAIANFTNAVRLMQEIKAAGCTFALDDFGSGLSSFAYLKHLPVDYLKIDGAFVKSVVTDPVDRAMVASINEIGHLMGLRTIAEFVEDDSILQELRLIGVDYAQGFGLGRPVPLDECLGVRAAV